MSGKLANRTALVTGGTRGIGLAIAKAFACEGARVVISGRDEKTGQAAASSIGELASFISCDVTEKDSIDALMKAVLGKWKKLDILVNNVGGATAFAPIMDMDDEMWQTILDLNLTSTFRASRAALKSMVPAGSGRIINISSVEGKHGKPGIVHYVAAKHAVNGFTKGLAKEVGTLGITVNAICPGLVLTDLIKEHAAEAAAADGLTEEQFLGEYTKEAAIGRAVTVEEVAAMALLLASDEGAGICGATLSVDGGTAAY